MTSMAGHEASSVLCAFFPTITSECCHRAQGVITAAARGRLGNFSMPLKFPISQSIIGGDFFARVLLMLSTRRAQSTHMWVNLNGTRATKSHSHNWARNSCTQNKNVLLRAQILCYCHKYFVAFCLCFTSSAKRTLGHRPLWQKILPPCMERVLYTLLPLIIRDKRWESNRYKKSPLSRLHCALVIKNLLSARNQSAKRNYSSSFLQSPLWTLWAFQLLDK